MKRKGFTLIELLAIIVILAIIAVITVPIILNIIDNSKKGAVIDSAYGYKDAIQNYYMSKSTNNASEEVPTGTYSVSDLPEDFKVSGETPTDGWIQLEKGKVVAYSLQFSDYVVTKEVNSEPTAEKNGTLAPNPISNKLQTGDTINYSTSLNGVTLDNWKLFYKEGDYAYIILGGYLPNTAVNATASGIINLKKQNTYEVYMDPLGGNNQKLLNAMTNKSNWSELVTNGTIDGESLNQTVSDDVWAMGSPTLDLWVNSWNTSYPNDRLYTSTNEQGYYIGFSENPTTDIVSLDDKEGYSNTLYYPYQAEEERCKGYWLASPSAARSDSSMHIYYNSEIGHKTYYTSFHAFRPVIRLPYSVISE